jgi:acetyl esterase/lipase
MSHRGRKLPVVAGSAAGLLLGLFGVLDSACAQTAASADKFVHVAYGYRVTPNIKYLTVNGWEGKLDVYQPPGVTTPNPTVVFIHGGAWSSGSKQQNALTTLPYMDMGWTVVNVDYRLVDVAPAPAAVEDTRCALRWIYRNAKQYNFDLNRLVLTGQSSGAHLALTTGMLPASAGMDSQCPGAEELKVAAIIDWYGITDVVDLLDGANMKPYAVTWVGNVPNRAEIAKRVSPLTYVRPGLPPVLMIQGDADPTVPYTHSVRLHQALDKAGVPNEFVTVPGGKHGNFPEPEYLRIYTVLRSFLTKHNLPTSGQATITSSSQ